MKLRHKIAGTLALPLALAIASTANAATVLDNDKHTLNIGGFVSGIASWAVRDNAAGHDSDINYDIDLGVSRLNVKHTQKTSAGDITYLYENDFRGPNGYRLRHAAIMYDGWVAGQFWSGFANLTGLAETIDAVGTSGGSANAQRTATLGKNFSIADGMSVGVFLEDHRKGTEVSGRTANTAIPDIAANFKGKFGGTDVFAGLRMTQKNDPTAPAANIKTEAKVDLTLGVSSQIGDMVNVKAALTSYDEGVKRSANGRDFAVSVAGQVKITDQIRTNLVIEQFVADANNSDSTAVWVNAFYKMEAGWEWGAELRSVSADNAAITMGLPGLADKDMSVALQAKYAF